jgi:protein-tyrosine phosphatase
LRIHLVPAALLLAIAGIQIHARASVATGGVENPTCEQIGPNTYRIEFQPTANSGAVEVFASSRPDRIDSEKSVGVLRNAGGNISVPERAGRIYFHLKSLNGATRVVSVRRLPLEGANNFRDLGGYRTADGHYVRWGLVYRSGYLVNLTSKDSAYLNSWNSSRVRCACRWRAHARTRSSPVDRKRS